MVRHPSVWIVDFGSQYTQLITRKCRELGFSSVIVTLEDVRTKFSSGMKPKTVILSGGPQSVFEDQTDYSFLFVDKTLPVLGVCYGMQVMGQFFGGKVERGITGEYGKAIVKTVAGFSIPDVPASFNVWMSHSDHVKNCPVGFHPILVSENGLLAGMRHSENPWWALQFHPEVNHTDHGLDILGYFLKNVAHLKLDWDSREMLEEALAVVTKVAGSKVLCAFSGGVDSLVAATLAQKVLGDGPFCFFVDNGLLRPQDYGHMMTLMKETSLKIEIIDAKDMFLSRLKGVADPEEKRKIIGRTFIDVFEQKIVEYEKSHGFKFEYLLQGTLYPDVIESISPHKIGGKSAMIKSHHNVGGLPETMKLKLLEPLRWFFKDEVRRIGVALNLKEEWVHRHPFPGPGIGVRVLGEVTSAAVKAVQQSDQILFEELHKQNLYKECWQAFTVFLPVSTVGVKGDARAYEKVIALRIVNSTDGMTANFSKMPYEFLSVVSHRITNEVPGITRVVYDVTSKPPGTIEWE